ncbi:3-keto-5-aminohexanoate cleavage protein [Mycobacterium sp. AMU20-3851]|uniref:3-keto-5-aminohexanoate cleavage protein n=1 Tax=Mycobacterium sp. AMU20-3851 TaxID=3122055 RepID=UPI003754E3A5
MMLQVCPNGPHGPARVPITVEDIVDSVTAAVAAGAHEVHVHPKAPDGTDSLRPEHVDPVVRALHGRHPGLPVGVTTGAWAVRNPADRLQQVRGWASRPDYASVNWHEEGAEELADLLLDMEVGVEAGLWFVEAAEAFRRYPRAGECTRILIEGTRPELREAVAEAKAIAAIVSALPLPVLCHGEGANAWTLFRLAVEAGFDSRIGLEDTFALPDGRAAHSNAELVRAAVELMGRG